jgi:putative PEP-CTERM system histidine kinase
MVSAGFTYWVAAAAMWIASAVVLMRDPTSALTRRVAAACAATGVWALVLALEARNGIRGSWLMVIADGVRYGSWFIVLPALSAVKLSPWLRRVGLALAGSLVAMAALGLAVESAGVAVRPAAGFASLGGLMLAFAGLVMTEQVIRNVAVENLRVIRLLIVGIAGQFAYDLFLYSQAQLLGSMHLLAWELRGAVMSLLALPLVGSFKRLPLPAPRVFISRHVVFYTTAFVAVGVYLLLMAIGGYYVRRHGGSWGNALEALFVGGAILVLGSLLWSDAALRRLRVFIAKHFYRNKYDYRLVWLRFVQTLSAAHAGDSRRAAIHAVAEILGSPGGLLVLRGDDPRDYEVQASWPGEVDTPATRVTASGDASLPAFLAASQWVIDLNEYADHPERYRDLVLPHWLTPRGPWRIVTPLLLGNQLLGFLVLRAPPEPFTMTFEDRDLLKTAGRHVAVQLAQQLADAKLAQGRQFDAYHRLTAFVMHDLKNAVAQLQLLVANAARHRHDPEFVEDAILTISNAVGRMTRLIEQLQSRDESGQTREVDLTAITRHAVRRAQDRRPTIEVLGDLAAAQVRADPDRLAAVIDHVIRNAQEATPADGRVELQLEVNGREAQLTVSDTGGGMDAEFVRERLFRPFDTTKGSKGMGIGAYQVREYVRSLQGDVEVKSTPGRGTQFCIRLETCPK